ARALVIATDRRAEALAKPLNLRVKRMAFLDREHRLAGEIHIPHLLSAREPVLARDDQLQRLAAQRHVHELPCGNRQRRQDQIVLAVEQRGLEDMRRVLADVEANRRISTVDLGQHVRQEIWPDGFRNAEPKRSSGSSAQRLRALDEPVELLEHPARVTHELSAERAQEGAPAAALE